VTARAAGGRRLEFPESVFHWVGLTDGDIVNFTDSRDLGDEVFSILGSKDFIFVVRYAGQTAVRYARREAVLATESAQARPAGAIGGDGGDSRD